VRSTLRRRSWPGRARALLRSRPQTARPARAAAPAPGGSPLRIGTPRVEADPRGGWRVTAPVDGHDVWFASADALLAPAPEAFASAFALAAAHLGRPLVVEPPLTHAWVDGAHAAQAVLADLYGLRGVPEVRARSHRADVAPAPRTALLFTAGVDSFWTLLRSGEPVDDLVWVDGYDVRLHEAGRALRVEERIRACAAATGRRAVVVRTNLRDHPAHEATVWSHTHGSALAAVGHLLAAETGRLLLSASWSVVVQAPWGSDWRLDPLWGTGHLRVDHVGHHRWRVDKIADLAGEPLVRRHLRVCWEHRTQDLNCSRCEKCVRTMMSLERVGELAHVETFDGSLSVAERLDALDPLPAELAPIYRASLRKGLPPATAAAVRRLMRRSGMPVRARPWRRD
jgi:hypothetical protein